MSSAAQALSGTSAPSVGFSSPADALKGQSQKYVEGFKEAESGARETRDKGLARIDEERDKLQPPKPQNVPQPQVHATDPVKAWGSLAMIAATLGSLFTRTPMTTALNAASTALKAFHEGDMERAKMAFDQWKTANDQAMKNEEYQNRLYTQQIAALDRRESMTERQYSDAVHAASAEMSAQARAFGDERMIAALEQNGLLGAQRLQVTRQNAAQRQAENAGKVEESYAKQEALHKLVNSDEYRKATPVQQLGMIAKASPSHAALSPAQAANLTLRMRKEMETVGIGKPFLEIQTKMPIIKDAERQMRENGHLNAQTAAAVVDGFQRIYNNQAVRIGLVKLNTEHAPYMDQLAAEASKFQTGGNGILPPNQAHDMLALLNEYMSNINKLKQAQVKDYRDTASALGLDPELIAPERYQTETHAHDAPQALRADPARLIGTALGVPVTITSGKRSQGSNRAAGGSNTSEHLTGDAWDFKPQGLGLLPAARRLASVLHANGQQFDQILIEPTEGIVHLGFGPKMRGQVAYYNKHTGKLSSLEGDSSFAHYSSANDVISAAKSGKLSRDQAMEILKSQFGYTD